MSSTATAVDYLESFQPYGRCNEAWKFLSLENSEFRRHNWESEESNWLIFTYQSTGEVRVAQGTCEAYRVFHEYSAE